MLISSQKGFTLIEILIAITILSFITIGVVTITDNSILTKDRTSQMNADNLQIETAMSRFEWDFSQIYSPLYFSQVMQFQGANTQNPFPSDGFPQTDPSATQPQFNPALAAYQESLAVRMQNNEHFMAVSREGIPIPRFYAPEKNIFEFFTTSNRRKIQNTKQSHFGWVRYTLGDAVERPADSEPDIAKVAEIPKGLKTLVRYYTADDPYNEKRINPEGGIEAEKVKASVLLEHVESLEFQFWNLQTRKWETSLRTIANGESLLHGVRILLSWYDSQGLKRTTDRIFRTHWPLVTPQDAATTGNTTGTTATAGQTTTGTDSGASEEEENE